MTKRHIFAIALIFVSTFLAYSNSLNGTWAMDDVIANKPVGINDIKDLVGFRRLTQVTFLLNQFIAPFSPANFRLFNILIHILNATLVYVLAYRTMTMRLMNMRIDKPQWHTHERAFYVALLSSLIFALHPININAVAYIIQRMASLATLFVLLSLLCYISAASSGRGIKAVVFYIFSGIFVVMGILSKENAVMAVPLILLYDYIFLSGFEHRVFIKKALVTVSIGIMSIGLTSYLLNLHTVFIGISQFFLNPNQPLTEKGWMAVDVYWTPLQHILTEFRVVSRYIFLMFIPLPQLFVFDWWGFQVSSSIIEPITTLLSIVFVMSLFTFSIWMLKRLPLLCFGILWYLFAISLESFLALGSDLYFEHRNYLPFSGLTIGIIGQAILSYKGRIKERALWTTAIAICLLLGTLTFSRNFLWKDSITLWEDTLRKNPSNLRAMMALGNIYLTMSNLDDAERYYKDVMRISGNDKRVKFLNESAYSLGMLYLFKGEMEQAKELIDKFDNTVESYRPEILKAFYKALNNDIDGALRDYNRIIGRAEGIDRVVVFTLMGDAYRGKGLCDKAIRQYKNAISLDPNFSAAYYGIGASYVCKRDLSLAREYFDKTLSLDPDNILALSDLADLILMKGLNPEDALTYAQRAVSKSPPFPQPYLTMGNVLIVLGREDEAESFYKKALTYHLPEYMIPFSRARAYYIKGDNEKARYYLEKLQRYKKD